MATRLLCLPKGLENGLIAGGIGFELLGGRLGLFGRRRRGNQPLHGGFQAKPVRRDEFRFRHNFILAENVSQSKPIRADLVACD